MDKRTTEAAIRNYQAYLDSKDTKKFEHNQTLRESAANYADFHNTKMNALKGQQQLRDFVVSIKESLLADCINYIFEGCFNNIYSNDEEYANLKSNLVNGFIKSEGAENLLNRFRYQSEMLAEMAYLVESTTDIIVEKSCSKDMTGCDFMIDTCDRDNFYDKLTSMSPEVARDKIRANVSDAFEEFITTNAKDREDIKDILNQAQEKINGAKNDELKESYSIVAKRKITNLKDKPTNILGEVVGKLAKAAVTDEVFKEQYTTNDGHVNMEAVVDASRVIYTFLEMVNTTKMAPMNESHIKDILENMFKK